MRSKTKIYSILLILLLSCNYFKREDPKEVNITPRKVELIKLLGEMLINDMNQKIYTLSLEGKIKAYKNDSLLDKDQISLSKLKDIGSYQEAIQYAPNPKDPDLLTDTVITNPFRITDICGNSIAEKWTFNQDKLVHRGMIWAFAINYKYRMQGNSAIDLPELPLFWIKYTDLKIIITKEQYKQLNKALHQTLLDNIYLN
jgi:hypothetical protein